MKKGLLTVGLLASFALASHAQKYLGVATSNWGGISSVYLNPANVADNKDRLVIDVLNLNAGIDNSLGKINSIRDISKFIKDDNTDVNSVFAFSNKKEFSLQAPYFEMRGPAIMASINHRFSFAITTRLRGFNQFNHFDQTLYRTILDTGYVSNGNIDLVSKDFNWTAHLWAETGLTVGAVVLEKGHHLVKVGATVRYLAGVGYLGLKGTLDAHYVKGADSFYADNLNMQYASNILTAQGALGVSSTNFFTKFFGKKQGGGIGGDLGVVYDYIQDTAADRYDMDGKTGLADQSKNRYKLRLSAAINDLGYIRYNQTNNYGLSVSGSGHLTGKDLLSNVKNFDDFRAYAKSKGFKADTGFVSSKLYMPATFMLSADYHAWRRIYVNALFISNIVNRQNFGNSYYNQFSITPRIDARNYSVAMPVTYSALAGNVKLGIGARYKGFFIGSDDMLVFITKHQYGANVYAGASITFHKNKPKDRDGDHVSDKRDRCPDEQGSWLHRGCPSKEDTADNCPEASGLELQDAKDTDGDGIPDSEDACPAVAGTAENRGCPDAHAATKDVVNLRKSALNWHNGKTKPNLHDRKVLDRFAKLLKEYPAQRLVIEGYVHMGKPAERTATALKEAAYVKAYLVKKGIEAGRIATAAGGNNAVSKEHQLVIMMAK